MDKRHYILIVIIALCSIACNSHSKHWDTLSQVESYIEERPDSALVVLEQLNTSELSGKEEKAKHALLYSMALDKNFVDKTDFEALQPAIDYYEDNGSATDKLRTYYYQGRIYHNIGNDAQAMTSYLNALEYYEDSGDILTLARIYVAMGNIYYTLLDWDKVCEVNLKAADLFYHANRVDSHVNCLLKAVSGYIQARDFERAYLCLQKCQHYIDTIPPALLSNYYSEYLTYLISMGTDSEIKAQIDIYNSAVPKEWRDHATNANGYLRLKEYEKALTSLYEIKTFSNLNSERRYYSLLTTVCQSQGMYKDALEAYNRFNEINNSVTLAIFNQDTQFIEERHKLEVENLHEKQAKHRAILICLIISIILIAGIIYIRFRLKIRTIMQTNAEQEAERYKLLYQQIEYEKDNLAEVLSQNNHIDDSIKNIIARRIELLNQFFTLHITNNSEVSRKVNKELDELLANKEAFMSSTRLAFAGSHPNFIKYLETHNLSEKEIEYCCLYALGLKGKEVGSYIKMRSHYNISSDVRVKLGLGESDTNLGIHLRRLLSAL